MLYVILSAVLFGMMPLFARIAYAGGTNFYTLVTHRFLIGALMLLAFNLLSGKSPFRVPSKKLLRIFLVSFPYATAMLLLFGSYTFIDTGLASALHFTYPVAVMLMMTLIFHAPFSGKEAFCTALCIAGIFLLNATNTTGSIGGMAMALLSGVFWATYIVAVGRSGVRDLPVTVLSFWVALFVSLIAGTYSVFRGKLVFSMTPAAFLAECLLALTATVFALVLFQRGILACGEVTASLLSAFEPVTGVVIGIIVFHEAFTLRTFTGIVCILAAVILLALRKKPTGT